MTTSITITSTATPALNGTYSLTPAMVAGIQGQVAAVALNATFADGSAALSWPDASNAMHSFDVAQFKTFAQAVGNHLSLSAIYMCGLGAAPPTTATIP